MPKQMEARQGKLSLPGIEIATTPQSVALADVLKAVSMFRRLGKPVLGVVESMAYFGCSHSEESIPVLGTGGGEMLRRPR